MRAYGDAIEGFENETYAIYEVKLTFLGNIEHFKITTVIARSPQDAKDRARISYLPFLVEPKLLSVRT